MSFFNAEKPRKDEKMFKIKINNKSVIIAILMIFITVISVFALNRAMQANANKTVANSNIAPYTYKMVLAYFEYWKDGNRYLADIPKQSGNIVRTNLGANPEQYIEWDYWFPVATLSGNYEIEGIMNYKDYNGTWEELNYTGGIPQHEIDRYYMNTAKIENEDAVIGSTNTTVKFQASFRPLSIDDAKKETDRIYRCYIAIVIKYKNLDYVEPEPEPEPEPRDNITVTIQYKDENGRQLMSDKTKKTSLGATLIENSERIEGYVSSNYSITGQETKNFTGNSTNVVVGLFNYSTPVNNNLNITFYYDEHEEEPKPTCDPQFDAIAEDKRIMVKRNDFQNATDILFSNVKIGVADFEGGHKRLSSTEWEVVEGEHEFHSFDIYLKYPGSTSYDYTRYDIYSQNTNINLNIPANKFTPTNTEKTEYVANVEVTLGVFCSCGGFDVQNTSLKLYVDIVENQPPDAYYRYATKKILPSGEDSRVYNKAYIDKEVVIDNYCMDLNGLTDIDYVRYIFRNKNNAELVKSIQLKMMPWGAYELDEYDLFDDTSIYFTGIENGNLRLIFTTDEEWEVTVYVQDTEGLNDSYTEVIKPEVLSLKPTAVVKDSSNYRYPFGEEFNGKQNRVIKLNSNNSFIATWLLDMNITLDHSKDMWTIEPLDGQDINLIKFERDINKYINGNTINVSYDPLDIKIMFKEAGRYKIRLQVTDTEGNVSDWNEQIITIHEDLIPSITMDIDSKYYRDTSKIATIKFNSLLISNDLDIPSLDNIGYKFDSNNNDNFDDETIQTSGISHKDINIDGVIYKEITLTSSKVGKYQIIADIKESFGQETLNKYITESDTRTARIVKTVEVDNFAPVGSLGLQKENNIDVKILTSGLTGTRNNDVQNNLSNLRSWLESEHNIKVGDIEVIDMAKTVNGLVSPNNLTWRRVLLGGPVENIPKFDYIEDFETGKITLLEGGIYADGWNGIEIPKKFIYAPAYKDFPDGYSAGSHGYTYVRKNFYDIKYGNNYVEMGNYNSGAWDPVIGDMDIFSTITTDELKDFDITFNLSSVPRGWPGTPLEPYAINQYFLFNVQDKNNYFVLYTVNNKRTELNYGMLNKIDTTSYPVGIAQIKNGKTNWIRFFSSTNDLGIFNSDDDWVPNMYKINRLVQVGNKLSVYATSSYFGNKKVAELTLDNNKVGGYIGITSASSLATYKMRLDMTSLSYLQNANMYDSIDNLKWKENSDKYIINLIEGNKVEELADTAQLNKTAARLQAEEITLINIGVNSVNGNKLKELTTKNNNDGTYIELGNVYNNLNSAATYIKNKYSSSITADDYILLGSKIRYLENYLDSEGDNLFSKDYRYNHIFNHFENNLGVINNNNIWIKNPIETFIKTGKYTLNYRVQDNPLFPDESIYNPFNSYRKYSTLFAKNIYVHRKPIANFAIDKSFKNNALIKTTIVEDFNDSTYNITPIFETYKGWGTQYENGYISNSRMVLNSYRASGSNYNHSYVEFDITNPANSINPLLKFDLDRGSASEVQLYIDDVLTDTISKSGTHIYDLTPGTHRIRFFLYRPTSTYTSESAYIDNLVAEYYLPNNNVQVPINENSYDLDHMSLSNKGIVEWQWKVVDRNGITTINTVTNRATGLSWISNILSTNQKWADASVQLRVKDIEGEYSDWTEIFIDQSDILDPNLPPDMLGYKPTADFIIDKNPLKFNSESQIITDKSSDPEGLPLTYIWKVKKGETLLFTSLEKDINSKVNEEIIKNGIGEYEISIIVRNTKDIYSYEVTKSFNVILFNDTPNVDFSLVSNESPLWSFPKILGLHTLKYRPTNGFFLEEKTRFSVNVTDPNSDNLGFKYNWKLERFAVKDINNITGTATNTYNYNGEGTVIHPPFTNSFKNQGLGWGAYRITLNVTDKPPMPPYASTDAKTVSVVKNYFIIPELTLDGSFESVNSEIMVGDTIKLRAKTSKETENVNCILEGASFTLSKVTEDSNYAYWEKNIVVPDSITESGIYQLQFIGNTAYGGNGNITREIRDTVSLNIVALKLLNFRITNIINHQDVIFPYTKDMLEDKLIKYKAGYYVTFQIDSKGKPDAVYGKIDIYNNGSVDQVINLTKIVSGDTEIWQGRFYTSTYLSAGTVVSIKLDCKKGATIYDYNLKENWGGRSLIVDGSALQDGRINLTN